MGLNFRILSGFIVAIISYNHQKLKVFLFRACLFQLSQPKKLVLKKANTKSSFGYV